MTAATFAVGSVAICGLPPLNGFVSEFLIYLGALKEMTLARADSSLPALAILGGLALIGGLAVACFTKAFGTVFLGEPRHDALRHTHSVGWALLAPMIALAAGCAAITWFAIPLTRLLGPVLASLSRQPVEAIAPQVAVALAPLKFVVAVSIALTFVAVAVALARQVLLSKRQVGHSPTWDCGFAQPTAQMQYTASSFAQLPVDYFAPILRTHQKITAPDGLFPTQARLETHPSDATMELCYRRAFSAINWGLSKLSWIQHGHVNVYVLYIAAALVALLIWYLGIAS
jgi:NADH:ubiquinone oxidoreductase subunit 5 (subunit L)/multisubunit Na+/H+ antiporter MnhA subunit